ncbi:hypothetical protein PoB_002949600 [Plakobranchus ocellatus]|uniref:Uncharacterized protein n=1 Tax=Plakobranchus ocellatus TaxID=259542 RepID=A0AAV4A455_9GAST|nr:hypothetical protein PoB_002949600 [Plakobranchus ocellatus]
MAVRENSDVKIAGENRAGPRTSEGRASMGGFGVIHQWEYREQRPPLKLTNFCDLRVKMWHQWHKVISSFRALRQARAPVARFKPATERSQGGLASHCATDAPSKELRHLFLVC